MKKFFNENTVKCVFVFGLAIVAVVGPIVFLYFLEKDKSISFSDYMVIRKAKIGGTVKRFKNSERMIKVIEVNHDRKEVFLEICDLELNIIDQGWVKEGKFIHLTKKIYGRIGASVKEINEENVTFIFRWGE